MLQYSVRNSTVSLVPGQYTAKILPLWVQWLPQCVCPHTTNLDPHTGLARQMGTGAIRVKFAKNVI